MKKLLYTENCPFDLRDWHTYAIKEIYAGINCIMAITDTGKVLQKIMNPDMAARTEFWTRIQQISVSPSMEGVAIGLVEDGTCLISKRAVRVVLNFENCPLDFQVVNNTVCSWKNIVQVAASDAFFALDADGNVHYIGLSRYAQNDYKEVLSWKNIRRIVTGVQSSIFGITFDGKILCAGSNCICGPHRNLNEKLSLHTDVVDLFPTGSACEDVYIFQKDGTVTNLQNTCKKQIASAPHANKILDGCFAYRVYGHMENCRLIELSHPNTPFVFSEDLPISSFAVGTDHNNNFFVLAISQD